MPWERSYATMGGTGQSQYKVLPPDDSGGYLNELAPPTASKPWERAYTAPQASEQPQDAPSIGRTILDQGLQGASFGFADELTDAAGSLGASIYTGEKFKDVYKDAREASKQRMIAEFEQNPGTSIASNVAGALLTGGVGASTKAGTTIANSVRTGNLAARAGKGAIAGAAPGAAYGAGTADEEQRMERLHRGAIYGAVGGAILPIVGAAVNASVKGTKNLYKGATARSIEQLEEAGNKIAASSSAAYQRMRDVGAVFNPKANGKILTNIDKAIAQDGIMHPSLHGKTIGLLESMKAEAKAGNFGLERLDQWRRALGRVPYSPDNMEDYRKARMVIDAIDDAVDNVAAKDLTKGSPAALQALKEGRAEWQRFKKFDTVTTILQKSDGDANYVKRELKKLLDNPKKTRGFSPAELAELKTASKLSTAEAVMKMAGKFGFDPARLGTGVGAGVGAGLGFAASGGAGAALAPVVGTAARYGHKFLTRGKTENLLRLLEQGKMMPLKAFPPTLPQALMNKSALPAMNSQAGLAALLSK